MTALLGIGSACDRFDPVGQLPSRFQFEQGAHAAVACEQCHPDEPATAQIVTCGGVAPAWDGVGCLQCHECDRVLHPLGNGHYPGQDCVACHGLNDTSWADAGGGGTITGGEANCSGACHGVARADAAPLGDAHGAHLDPSTLWSTPGSCDACHPPDGLSAPTHNDGVIDLPFGLLASIGGATPSYAGGSCSGTYCHGASLPEGGHVPSWTGGPADAACGTCHGQPPQHAGHPDLDSCEGCHAPTGGTGGVILDPSTHIDGTTQL